jgi:prophage regulatory protein
MTDRLRFLTFKETRERVALSRTHIYRRIGEGTFPKPIPLGGRRIAFLESEISEWQAQCVAARERGEGARARREQAQLAAAARLSMK